MKIAAATTTLALLLTLQAPAWAAAASDDEASPTIVVTGHADEYKVDETSSATKTNTPLLDVPQSISVVTSKQIADQQIRSIIDLVRYIPGATGGQGEGNRDQITLRGNNSTANFFVDGLRDDVQYFRSFYNIDRVEVHKGANAMIFGRGGGGGIVNRVTKRANAAHNAFEGTGSVDTFGSYYTAADVNVVLGKVGLRVNAFYEDLNNHRDAFGGERYAFNPTLGGTLGETRFDVGYESVKDDRVIDRGIPSFGTGTILAPVGPVRGFRDAFFGVRGINDAGFEAHVGRFASDTDLSDTLKLTTQVSYGDYDKFYTNVFPVTSVRVGAPATVGLEAYTDTTTRQSLIGQANLIWNVSTGGIKHVILAGGEYTDQDSIIERINGFFSPTIFTAATRRVSVPFGNPISVPPVTFVAGPRGDSNRRVASKIGQVSLYVQDQLSFGDHFDVIAGVRYDRFDSDITNEFAGATVSRVDELWSPRVGLVYKPVPQASLYASYSKSYLPQSGDQFATFDLTNAALEPEAFQNYEAGAKWDIRPGLTATFAVYQLDRSNTRASGPVAGTVVLTGKQRSRGVEIGVAGQVTPQWNVSLGYAHTVAEISQTTSAAPAGRRIGQTPRNQFSLWNRYDVTRRLGVGAGVYYQSRQFASISNTVSLPAYTRIDAALFYKLTDRIAAQINVENLTDKGYFPVAHNDNNISTGAPINARFTIIAKF